MSSSISSSSFRSPITSRRVAVLALLAALPALHAADVTWTGTTSGTWNTSVNNNWSGGATIFTNGDNVSLDDTGLTRPSISVAAPITVGSMSVSNTTGNYQINATTTNTLGGTTLTKSGAGTLSFIGNGPITFSNTTLGGGTLVIRQGTFNGGAINVSADTTVSNNSNGAGILNGTTLTGSSVLNIAPFTAGAFILGSSLDTSGFTGTISSSSADGRVNVLNSSANLSQATVELSGGALFQSQSTTTVRIGEITAGSSTKLGSGFGAGSAYEIGALNTDSSVAGVIQNGGLSNTGTVTGGVIGLTKVGTGDLSLTGVNTYTGATTVNAGALLVGDGTSGSIASALTVNAGAFYGNLASGNVTSAAVTIGDGAGSADALFGAGRDTIGRFASADGLNLASDASFVFDVNSFAETTDTVSFGGAITLGGLFTLNDLGVGGVNWSVSDSFTVLSGLSVAGTFTNLADGSFVTVNDVTYQAAYTADALTLTVTSIASIPEPASLGLLLGLGGLGSALCVRRRRRA